MCLFESVAGRQVEFEAGLDSNGILVAVMVAVVAAALAVAKVVPATMAVAAAVAQSGDRS